MLRRILGILLLSVLCSTGAYAQEDSLAKAKPAGDEYLLGLFPRQEPDRLQNFGISGSYRFFGTYTNMGDDYLLSGPANAYTNDRTLFIGDDSQLPNMWMTVYGSPGPRMSFNMDVYMFQFMESNLGETYGTQVLDSLRPPIYNPRAGTRLGGALGLQLGINMTGSFSTDVGSFTARMGGTHWYYLSEMTFASFRGFNRFTLFERNPWDPVQRGIADRYSQFYNEGSTQQDLRWGNRAFHGLILEGAALPRDFSFSLLYGKTELNGGFDQLPNSSIGGRLRHDSPNGFQSYNTFNSRTFADTIASSSIGFNIHTLELEQKVEEITLHAELGAGRYYAPSYESKWGEAIDLKLKTDKSLLGFPLQIHYFRIAPEVINNNAVFWNTSIVEVTNNDLPAGVAGSTDVLRPFASSMLPIGLMTNNRTGIDVNADLEFGDLKIGLGYGLTSEMEGLSNSITLSHAVNQLTRSRFWRWNFFPDQGPYERYDVVYRDAFETIELTDARFGTEIPRKHFTTAELQAKYNTQLFRKEIYLFYLGRYGTVQPEFQAIIPLNEDAYVRQYTSEFEAYIKLSEAVVWTNYFGIERIIANYSTEVDTETRKPRNQEGMGIGTGIDVSLGKNSVLGLRHRYFEFEDRNFALDKFNGQETLAEIKVFF